MQHSSNTRNTPGSGRRSATRLERRRTENKHPVLGFTIVELLIVIVVIGILAAITIVAYGGIQSRARDVKRTDDAAKIMGTLEAYKVLNGKYPATNATPASAINTTPTLGAGSYSYSVASDDTWLKGIVQAGFTSNPPRDPINDGVHYYSYYRANAGDYGCDPTFGAFYVLAMYGYENTADVPKSTFAADKRCQTAPWSSWAGANYTIYYGWEN